MAFQWTKISRLPPILTLPLQRFVYNIKTGNREKNTTPFEFPFEIDLKDFCEVIFEDRFSFLKDQQSFFLICTGHSDRYNL